MNIYLLVGIKFFLGILVTILQIHILGKYEFSVNTPLNQIQNYILGGIIGGVIYNTSISILTFLIFTLVWSLVVIIVGNPVVLIKNGVVNVANCAKVGLSAEQLMLHIRMEGLTSTKEVKSAIMETNGMLTIIDMQSATPKFPIISNCKLNHDILELIGHTEEWLLDYIKEQGVESIQDVFLGEYVNGELHITAYTKIK